MNLFISSATNQLVICLFEGNTITYCVDKKGANDHTTKLYEYLSEVDLTNVENTYVVTGPGSFTGLRVAMIFAKMLTIRNGGKIIPINLMELMYYQEECPIKLDARGKKHYYYSGEKTDLVSSESVEDIIEPTLNINKIINEKILLKFPPHGISEVAIEYYKKAF